MPSPRPWRSRGPRSPTARWARPQVSRWCSCTTSPRYSTTGTPPWSTALPPSGASSWSISGASAAQAAPPPTVRQRRDQVRSLPVLVLHTADGLAVNRDHQTAADLRGPRPQPGAENLVELVRADHGERAPERGLLRRAARRAQPGQHVRPGIGSPLPDRGERPRPRDHRRDADGEQPGQRVPPPAPLCGSGIWARRSRRYWMRAAGTGEDVIGGRGSLVAGDGERENFHRSARALPATRGHAGRFTRCHDIAGHSLTS